MKMIMVMYDSLNRRMLSPYGCDWVQTPNFARLARRAVTFDTSYVCSMPCMPARRDFHTGRPNFLHRSWGPLEPWDDSVPAMLTAAGVHTHIVTDHQHYWEEGAGGNYLSKYGSHEMIRGQEGDPWRPLLEDPGPSPRAMGRNASPDAWMRRDRANRKRVGTEADMPQAQTFAAGLEFIERHADADNWFLQIETFDPHEPFFVLPEHRERYAALYEKCRDALWDWPPYAPVKEPPEEVALMRANYAALTSVCDDQLGKLLDLMDARGMWEDTMLVVWTDHGFLLGEHGCWAKCWMPFYEEIARTPFFVWDPRCGKAGERRRSIVQPSIDLGPTLLDAFGLAPTKDMTGHSLRPVLRDDTPLRDTAIFGIFGGQVNITDGRYVYMRAAAREDNQPLHQHTLMPAHMREAFALDEFEGVELGEPFSFTKGVRPLRILSRRKRPFEKNDACRRNLLFDLREDPGQARPLDDPGIERRFVESLGREMEAVDAPGGQFARLGLSD